MANQPDTKPSALAKFNLGFEFDKSWHEAKKDVRVRTDRD
jgi:hypothetical protein